VDGRDAGHRPLAAFLAGDLNPADAKVRDEHLLACEQCRRAVTHPEPGPGRPGAPVEVGHPVTVAAGGQQMVLRVWRLGDVEAVIAVSAQPFAMPARAHGAAGPGMAWTARQGSIGLYCRNGHTSELVTARVPEAQLAALAARLPPT
jgi:hypothetical protein